MLFKGPSLPVRPVQESRDSSKRRIPNRVNRAGHFHNGHSENAAALLVKPD